MIIRDYLLIFAGFALGVSLVDFVEGWRVLPILLGSMGAFIILLAWWSTPHKNANTLT